MSARRDAAGQQPAVKQDKSQVSVSPTLSVPLGARLGNLGLRRLLQAKLEVGRPDSVYELEADRVADQVMRMPMSPAQVNSAPAQVVQRVCSSCEEEIQRASSGAAVPTIDTPLADSMHSLAGGEPLSKSVRSFMEPRFGADFSAVRVHTDANAQWLARSVEAKAFTVGTNVVFGAGHYAPETESGKHLLAHELTHVVQQKGGQSSIQRAPDDAEPVVPARPRTLSLLAPDPRAVSDEQIYGGLDEAKQTEDEELVQARKAEIAKLLQLIADSPVRYSWHDVTWTKDDRKFALSLLRPLLRDRTHIDPRAVLDHIRQPILDRYRRWLVAQDDFRRRNCWDPKGPWHMDGVMGLLVEIQTKLHPEIDPCHSWFADEDSHGPAELRSLERVLKLDRMGSRGDESPADCVYQSVWRLRKRTDAAMLQGQAIASGIVNKIVAVAGTGTGGGPLAEPPAGRLMTPPESADMASMRVVAKVGDVEVLANVNPVRAAPTAAPSRVIDAQSHPVDSGMTPSPKVMPPAYGNPHSDYVHPTDRFESPNPFRWMEPGYQPGVAYISGGNGGGRQGGGPVSPDPAAPVASISDPTSGPVTHVDPDPASAPSFIEHSTSGSGEPPRLPDPPSGPRRIPRPQEVPILPIWSEVRTPQSPAVRAPQVASPALATTPAPTLPVYEVFDGNMRAGATDAEAIFKHKSGLEILVPSAKALEEKIAAVNVLRQVPSLRPHVPELTVVRARINHIDGPPFDRRGILRPALERSGSFIEPAERGLSIVRPPKLDMQGLQRAQRELAVVLEALRKANIDPVGIEIGFGENGHVVIEGAVDIVQGPLSNRTRLLFKALKQALQEAMEPPPK